MSTTVPTVLRIEPRKGWVALRLGELWQYRELLYFLTWRDIKVRYRQTVLGVLWAIMVPLISMILFTVVFARMANVASDNRPYPVFNLAALLPWNFFAAALAMCANSVSQTSHLMSKVYFPRLIAPISSVAAVQPVASEWRIATSCIHCTYCTLLTCPLRSIAVSGTVKSKR